MRLCTVTYYKFATLTQSTTVQLHPHGDVSVPGPGVNTEITGFYGWAEPVHYHEVSLGITLEYLEYNRHRRSSKVIVIKTT